MVDAYSSRTTVEQYAGSCVGASVGWEITIVRGVDHGMHVARSIYKVGPVPLADPVECPTSPNGLHDNSRWRVVRYRGYRYRLAHLLENHPRFERDTRTYPQGAAPGPWPIFQGVQVVFPRFRPGAGAQAALRRAPAHVRKSGPSIAANQSRSRNAAPSPHLLAHYIAACIDSRMFMYASARHAIRDRSSIAAAHMCPHRERPPRMPRRNVIPGTSTLRGQIHVTCKQTPVEVYRR